MKMMTAVGLGVLLMAAPQAHAQSFPDTEYVSGRSGFGQKTKGTLVVEEGQLRFQDKNGALVFAIPMSQITDALDSREHNDGSFGRKVALGIFAGKTEEFLTVKTQTADNAEAVIFKCKKKTAPGIAAKVSFYAKKAKDGGTH
jgi:hypothetical protein